MECANCARTEATRLCGLCKCLAYCGDDCARTDWARHWSDAHPMISSKITRPPNDIDEIPGVPGLFVGGLNALHHLEEFNIRTIITAIPYNRRYVTEKQLKKWVGSRVHMRIPWKDEDDQIMDFDILCNTARFIHNHLLQGHHVLVHCAAGMSRSVSIIIFYMMHKPGRRWKTVKQALWHIRKARPIAGPNKGFIAQLKEYASKPCPF